MFRLEMILESLIEDITEIKRNLIVNEITKKGQNSSYYKKHD